MVLLCIPSKFGLVKFGWELSGLVWFGTILFCLVWFGLVQFDMDECLVVFSLSLVWMSLVGVVEFSLVWISSVRCG